jgi:hypothetical protein
LGVKFGRLGASGFAELNRSSARTFGPTDPSNPARAKYPKPQLAVFNSVLLEVMRGLLSGIVDVSLSSYSMC